MRHCRYCGGGAVDLDTHEANCVMRPDPVVVRAPLDCKIPGAKASVEITRSGLEELRKAFEKEKR